MITDPLIIPKRCSQCGRWRARPQRTPRNPRRFAPRWSRFQPMRQMAGGVQVGDGGLFICDLGVVVTDKDTEFCGCAEAEDLGNCERSEAYWLSAVRHFKKEIPGSFSYNYRDTDDAFCLFSRNMIEKFTQVHQFPPFDSGFSFNEVQVRTNTQIVGPITQMRIEVRLPTASDWRADTDWVTVDPLDPFASPVTFTGSSSGYGAVIDSWTSVSTSYTISKRPGCACPASCNGCGFLSGPHTGGFRSTISGTGVDDGVGFVDVDNECSWAGSGGSLSCDGTAWYFFSVHGKTWTAARQPRITCCPPLTGWAPVAPNTGALTLSKT